jgi:hypothetical protein
MVKVHEAVLVFLIPAQVSAPIFVLVFVAFNWPKV